MAKRSGRYAEGRFYMTWAALALLLASWAGIATHDQVQRRQEEDSAPDAVTTQPSPAPGGTIRTAPIQPQTRTRGS